MRCFGSFVFVLLLLQVGVGVFWLCFYFALPFFYVFLLRLILSRFCLLVHFSFVVLLWFCSGFSLFLFFWFVVFVCCKCLVIVCVIFCFCSILMFSRVDAEDFCYGTC